MFLDRVTTFVKDFLGCLRKIPPNTINKALLSQAVRSASSIGANYCEALESESRRDFAHKMSVCKKEAKETIYWIDLLYSQNEDFQAELTKFRSEVHQYVLIFAKSQMTARGK